MCWRGTRHVAPLCDLGHCHLAFPFHDRLHVGEKHDIVPSSAELLQGGYSSDGTTVHSPSTSCKRQVSACRCHVFN